MPIDEIKDDNVNNNNDDHHHNNLNNDIVRTTETEADGESVASSDSGASLGAQLSSRWKFYNVILMGITFMFLFTAFNTCSMIQTLVLEGANIETNNTSGNGYTSLALLYGSFAASNWVAPSFVAVFNSKWSMIIGSSLYCVFIGFFLRPNQISLYVTSVLIGFGAAILWTAQGKFLMSNSTLDTMTRNTGIFWVLFQSSLIWGNIFVIFKFTGLASIDGPTRTAVFIGLTSAACLGCLLMLFFKSEPKSTSEQKVSPLGEFVQSVKLLFNKEMLLLSVIFFYTGLSTSFWSSVFITSVGHMNYFEDDAKQLSGLCGLTAGFGEICGGLLFGIFSKFLRINASNRGFVMFVGYVLQMVALFAVFLTLAPESPIVETDNLAYFTPNKVIVLVSAFLLGLGDSSFITQIYPSINHIFPIQISCAVALFKFIQSLASTAAFVYSQYLLLQWQLIILATVATLGCTFFFMVERINHFHNLRRFVQIQSES